MMTIQSLNLGEIKTVSWRGSSVKTGIFKHRTDQPIFLGKEDVKNDNVVDRKYHGGIDKACYAYSSIGYHFWQETYPNYKFTSGFFGENLTVDGLDESSIRIGSQYQIGEAIVEVSQPREPCFKLGIRFGSQSILKPFINSPYPGVYFRVIKKGFISIGDSLILLSEDLLEPTILEVYRMIFGLEKKSSLLRTAIDSTKLAESARQAIRKQFNKLD
ncbi:MAG: MOSC domain-containing protein [Crocinitomicaceae bacterium]